MVLTETRIIDSLKMLNDESKPLFGKMTNQHMVEHLIITKKLSIGKIKYPEFTPSERALKSKEILLFTELEMPMGMTPPHDTGNLYPLKYSNLDESKEELITAWNEYLAYFEKNKEAKNVHPRFGYLNHDEWNRFHYKHFMHHFKQFGVWLNGSKS